MDVVPSSLSKKRRREHSDGDASLQITLETDGDKNAKRRKVINMPITSPPRKPQVRFLLPDTGSASVEQGGNKSPGESR